MSENIQARIGMGIPASVSPVLADMEIRDLKDKLAAAEARAERLESLYRHERDEYRPDEPGRPLLTEDYDEETEAAIKDAKEETK